MKKLLNENIEFCFNCKRESNDNYVQLGDYIVSCKNCGEVITSYIAIGSIDVFPIRAIALLNKSSEEACQLLQERYKEEFVQLNEKQNQIILFENIHCDIYEKINKLSHLGTVIKIERLDRVKCPSCDDDIVSFTWSDDCTEIKYICKNCGWKKTYQQHLDFAEFVLFIELTNDDNKKAIIEIKNALGISIQKAHDISKNGKVEIACGIYYDMKDIMDDLKRKKINAFLELRTYLGITYSVRCQ